MAADFVDSPMPPTFAGNRGWEQRGSCCEHCHPVLLHTVILSSCVRFLTRFFEPRPAKDFIPQISTQVFRCHARLLSNCQYSILNRWSWVPGLTCDLSVACQFRHTFHATEQTRNCHLHANFSCDKELFLAWRGSSVLSYAH